MINKEVLGFKLELAGLIFLFLGTFWQANFSGWWDKNAYEWQYWIQEEVNLTLLNSVNDIASMMVIEREDLKENASKNIADSVNHAKSFAISEGKKRRGALTDGQAALFANIEKWLLLLGAMLLIVGKWCSLQGVKERDQ